MIDLCHCNSQNIDQKRLHVDSLVTQGPWVECVESICQNVGGDGWSDQEKLWM